MSELIHNENPVRRRKHMVSARMRTHTLSP